MNRGQEWSFTLQARCPHCRKDARFMGTVVRHHLDTFLNLMFITIATAAGLPLLLLDTPDLVRYLGSSLVILGGWTTALFITRTVYQNITKRGAARCPPDPKKDKR